MILCAAILALTLTGGEAQTPNASDLFKDGHFAEAIKACDAALHTNPNDTDTAILKGRALVFSNRLADAKQALVPIAACATATTDQKKSANGLLGEAAYRQDDFAAAATCGIL